MTLPDERYRAIRWTEEFLTELCDPKRTPGVPKRIRDRARSLLRHYPSGWDLDRAAWAAPEIFQSPREQDRLYKMVREYSEQDPECTNTVGDDSK